MILNSKIKGFESFLNKGIVVRPHLTPGNYEAEWRGLDINMAKMTFTFKFKVADKEYDFSIEYSENPLSPDSAYSRADQIVWTCQDLHKAFKLDGPVAFQDFNNFIGMTVPVQAIKSEKGTVYYTFKKPVEQPVVTEVKDSTEF